MKNKQVKHPASLGIFFATEMWERYGFYVIQTLLVLYLLFHFKWQDKQIYVLVGTFTALSYFSPLIGGWIADRWLGQKRTIFIGGVFLFFSYLSFSIYQAEAALFPALAGIVTGTGLLKPNISSLLGNAYSEDSPIREKGFTIFYMGITLGILLGTTIPSQLKNHFGWGAPFASAAFGISLSLVFFIFGIYRYKIADYHPTSPRFSQLLRAFSLIFLLWLVALFVLINPFFSNVIFILVITFSLFYFFFSIRKKSDRNGRKSVRYDRHTIVIGLLCTISILFSAFYFQLFLSLIVFVARVVEPNLFGFSFPPPYYITIESLGVMIFGYFISRNGWLGIHGVENIGNKFILAMGFMVFAFGLFPLISESTDSNHLLSPLYLIPCYLMISIAELLVSPTSLSAITLLSDDRKVSTMVGLFFVSLGVGGFLSGKLAKLTAINPEMYNLAQLKLHYAETFTRLFIILLIFTLFSLILNRFIHMLLNKSRKDSLSS